jgi:hypothetical protein
VMSALSPKADIVERERHVRFVPIADIERSIRTLRQQAELIWQARVAESLG